VTNSPLLDSLIAAVAAAPDDLPLRLHLAELLIDADRRPEAVGHLAQVLVRQPADPAAQALMARAVGAAPAAGPAPSAGSAASGTASPATDPPAGDATPPTFTATPPEFIATPPEFNWKALEEDLADVIPPRFAPSDDGPPRAGDDFDPVRGDADGIVEVQSSSVTINDVGGMEDVKRRLELAFFGPLRNPQMRALYGKSLRGGLLLYGPPGCGKTFLARAVAGEMGAKFVTVSIVDVLNMWIGNSERNLHEIFEAARRNAPCVLFLDELDALGHKRSQMTSTSMRTIGNQLLTELDGVDSNNDGVFVLAATNAPWDVDAALRRPGRFDRMCLVLPPDQPARSAILEYHLRERPVANIDLGKLAAATDDFSGADLAHLCDTAAENAMADSIRSGQVRMIEQRDFEAALHEVRPTTKPWFATARNVAMFANEGGAYDDLAAYLKRRKLI
jgi:AAA+ superfamily predicted ATPase